VLEICCLDNAKEARNTRTYIMVCALLQANRITVLRRL
jgi:hypothetical protein